MNKRGEVSEQLLLSELQVLLAEKRTHFAVLRTGLAIGTVPLTVIVFLVATSSYHNVFDYVWLGGVIVAILLGLSISGAYLSLDAGRKIGQINEHIKAAEKSNSRIDSIIV